MWLTGSILGISPRPEDGQKVKLKSRQRAIDAAEQCLDNVRDNAQVRRPMCRMSKTRAIVGDTEYRHLVLSWDEDAG